MGNGALNVLLNLVGVVLGGGALGVLLTHRYKMRTLKVQDDADVRDHDDSLLGRYVAEVERLSKRQRECEEREEALRDRVTTLEHLLVERDNDILGLIRIITQASADRVLLLDQEASAMIHDMALRIKQHRTGMSQ